MKANPGIMPNVARLLVVALFVFNMVSAGITGQCDYTFGLMGPISASDNWIRIVMGGAVAFDMVNDHDNEITKQLFPDIDFKVCYPIFDDGGNPSWGINHVFKMVFSKMYDPANPAVVKPDVLGIVGPGYSSVSKPVSLLASVNEVPLMSYSATSGQLSDKSQYPNFARVVPSDDEESRVVGAFVESFGWKKVIIFACDDDFCTGYADSLLKQRFEYQYEVVASTTFPVTDHEGDGEAIKAALKGIKDLNCRIILMPILPMHVKFIHQKMEELNMFTDNDDSFVWITPMGTAVAESLDEVETKRGGHLVVQYRTPSNDVFQKGLRDGWDGSINAWKSELVNNAWLAETIAKTDADINTLLNAEFDWSFTPYVFDCALVFVKAIYDLRKASPGTEITSKMILDHWPSITDFKGATGPIRFTKELDRLVDFELVNQRKDLSADKSTYGYHPVRYWSAPDPSQVDAEGELLHPHGNVAAASEDYDVHWSSTMTDGNVPHHSFAAESEGMSQETLILISVGSVAGLFGVIFFVRYLSNRWKSENAEQRYDPNVEHRKSVRMSIIKSIMALMLEIADYITDAASAANVFSLYEKDIIPVGLVVFYLMVLCVGGVLNFGNLLWRSRNFLEMLKEYNQGVSISAADGRDDALLVGESMATGGGDRARAHSLADDINTLKARGASGRENVKVLEDLTVKIVNATRQIRIEKFTFVLGLLEDMPIAVMNSILMMKYMDDIDFPIIYFSTLTTLMEFGVKTISLEKVFMLKMRLRVLRGYVDVQRRYSIEHIDDPANKV